MLTPIAGEITEREPYNGYLIFQGGTPEVEEFFPPVPGGVRPGPKYFSLR
jgi:glutamyl-tRNA(Gln) amidotransferase subunit D